MRLFIQRSAEADIVRQADWYAEQGAADVARRFHTAVLDALDALAKRPKAGAPRATDNLRLAGLRS